MAKKKRQRKPGPYYPKFLLEGPPKPPPGDRTHPIELSCGHLMYYPDPLPRLGDTVWCGSCDDYRQATYRLEDN